MEKNIFHYAKSTDRVWFRKEFKNVNQQTEMNRLIKQTIIIKTTRCKLEEISLGK